MGRMTPKDRVLQHKKQERISTGSGIPRLQELEEGVPVLRLTAEGLVQYVKYRNFLYKRAYIKAEDKEGIDIIT